MARTSNKKKQKDEEPEYVVEAIKDHERKKGTLKYLIKWKGYNGKNDNTWEPEAEINPITQVVERYWKSKQPEERLERYKVNSKEYKRLQAELLAAEEEEEDEEGEEEEEEEDEKKKSSGKKGKSTESGKKRKSSEQVENGSNSKKAKKEKSEEEEVVEGTATEVETNGVVANGEKGAAEEEGLAGSEGYDTAGRALIPWTEITDARKAGSWEDLIFKVETVERDENSESEPGLKMLVIWNKENHAGEAFESWVPAPVTRKTCPQKMLDFYESNLKFRNTEGITEEDMAKLNAEEAAEGGGGEGEERQPSPAHGEVEL